MKIAVLILGVLGALLSLGLGAKWVADYNDNQATVAQIQQMSQQMGGNTELDASLAELESVKKGGYALVGFGLLSFIASFLVFKMPKVTAAIMILALIVPAIFTAKTLLATALLGIGGVLAFLVKPKTTLVS